MEPPSQSSSLIFNTRTNKPSMSEETHDAATLGPIAIQSAVIVSGAMGWLLTISLCFCLTDFEGILNTPTGLPAAQIFLNAGGKTGGMIMWGFAVLVQLFTGCSAMLADTRMAYAFARDEALPFSSYDPVLPKYLLSHFLSALSTTNPN
jgi:amino acid transporter